MAPTPSTTRRILVGLDGSDESEQALLWALEFAGQVGAAVEVLTGWQLPTSYGWAAVPDWDLEGQSRDMQDKVVRALSGDHPGVEVRRRVLRGHPALLLVEESQNADLLVVGSRGHGEFAGMLLGSVSEHCVTHAKCPVLVIRGDT